MRCIRVVDRLGKHRSKLLNIHIAFYRRTKGSEPLELDKLIDFTQPLNIFLQEKRMSQEIAEETRKKRRTCCSLCAAYSGMNEATEELIPLS